LKYWSLGDSGTFAQRVLAARVWAAYSPTWETQLIAPDVVSISNRPPANRGASLGGVERQRGYPRGRFNDKAAINYALELRLIPHWDPFRNWPLIRNWPWRWWQVVGFAEIGRVAPSWNFGDLHEDMKWTAGAGIRAMLGGGIIRLDYAVSDEAAQFWVMARQAF
jgi:outer membrane translocation and assembly module TamA